jgi:D-lactate dehydrogenase (cytochrome)
VCVPISELANALAETRRMIDQYDFKAAAVLGHVGDGNFHVVIGVDPSDKKEVEQFITLNREVVEFALSKGGTCSGEHGIGIGKKEYLLQEHPSSVPVMKKIKAVLDPMLLLNPGKIFDV